MPGREAQQNRADVEAGLKTLEDHFLRDPAWDFREELEKRALNARAILGCGAQARGAIGHALETQRRSHRDACGDGGAVDSGGEKNARG